MKPEELVLENPETTPWSMLSNDQVQHAIGIRDYMLGPGRYNPDPDETLVELSTKILAAGIPLYRCVTIVRILHAINTASFRMWDRKDGVTSFAIPFESESDGMYENSPSALAHQTRKWVCFNPQETPEQTFGIVRELQQEAYTSYVCAPTLMVNGLQNVFTFASKDKQGFSQTDLAFLRCIFPALEACQEILVTHRILKEVTRTYVGAEPHERILSGDVHRGEVTSCQAAILFTDMRDFTGITSEMTTQSATDLLNEYYDCVVPAIEDNGGEVLKFMGDGILAMFRKAHSEEVVCQSALTAAQMGLNAVEDHNVSARHAFHIGTALHFGDVAYGNVGSGERLDYTVIGRDVNLTSRLAGLCKPLNRPLLLSEQIAQRLGDTAMTDCGKHKLKGLSQPVTVFAT